MKLDLNIDLNIHPFGPAPAWVAEFRKTLARIEHQMSQLTDQAAALKADVDRVLADQAAAISKAVTDALAQANADDATTSATLSAITAAVDAFDPPPVAPADGS